MKGIKTIAYIAAGILILFGVLFIIGSGGDTGGGWGWVLIGIILVVIAFVIILFASRRAAKEANNDIQRHAEHRSSRQCQHGLPSNANPAAANSIPMTSRLVAGAPVVSCPYCHTSYQITEEPKW